MKFTQIEVFVLEYVLWSIVYFTIVYIVRNSLMTALPHTLNEERNAFEVENKNEHSKSNEETVSLMKADLLAGEIQYFELKENEEYPENNNQLVKGFKGGDVEGVSGLQQPKPVVQTTAVFNKSARCRGRAKGSGKISHHYCKRKASSGHSSYDNEHNSVPSPSTNVKKKESDFRKAWMMILCEGVLCGANLFLQRHESEELYGTWNFVALANMLCFAEWFKIKFYMLYSVKSCTLLAFFLHYNLSENAMR